MSDVSRKSFLKNGAAAVSVLVAGGVVWRAWDQGVFQSATGPAYEPWQNWAGEAHEGLLALIPAAILAANPHNTQPWKFDVGTMHIDVFADVSRSLGAMDVFHREMFLGLGCALENLLLSARAKGYSYDVKLMPDPADENHAATVTFRSGSAAGAAVRQLFDEIPRRHTDRHGYDVSRDLGTDVRNAMQAVIQREPDDLSRNVRLLLFAGEDERRVSSEAIVQATEFIVNDPDMLHASAAWGPRTWPEIQKLRDGITLDAAGLPPMIRVGGKMLPPLSHEEGHRMWLQATREKHCPTASAFGIIAVRNRYDRAQSLEAGRLWQRLHLWASAEGISLHPMNQVIEVADQELKRDLDPVMNVKLAELCALRGASEISQATFHFRAGYPTSDVLPSPRRALEDVLV